MTLQTAKALSKGMLIAALVSYIACAVLMQTGAVPPEPFAVAGTALLGLAVVVRFLWAKCPHCHRRIGYKQLNRTECPYCRKSI